MNLRNEHGTIQAINFIKTLKLSTLQKLHEVWDWWCKLGPCTVQTSLTYGQKIITGFPEHLNTIVLQYLKTTVYESNYDRNFRDIVKSRTVG